MTLYITAVQRHLAIPPQEYIDMFMKTFPHVRVRHPANPVIDLSCSRGAPACMGTYGTAASCV